VPLRIELTMPSTILSIRFVTPRPSVAWGINHRELAKLLGYAEGRS